MNKQQAIQALGGTITAAAEACDISYQAVHKWPDELTKNQIARVQAALYRQAQKAKRQRKRAKESA